MNSDRIVASQKLPEGRVFSAKPALPAGIRWDNLGAARNAVARGLDPP